MMKMLKMSVAVSDSDSYDSDNFENVAKVDEIICLKIISMTKTLKVNLVTNLSTCHHQALQLPFPVQDVQDCLNHISFFHIFNFHILMHTVMFFHHYLSICGDGDPGSYDDDDDDVDDDDDDDDDCNEPCDPCRLSLVFTGVHHPVVAFPLKPNQIVRSIIRSTGNRQNIGIFADD